MHMAAKVKMYRTYNTLIYESLLKIKFVLTPLLMLCQPMTVLSLQKIHILKS